MRSGPTHDRAQVSGATQCLRGLARRIVDAVLERVPLQAALLAGSAGRGDADFYSDIDLLLYVDALPPEQTFAAVRAAVGGTDPIRREPTDYFCSEEFDFDGVRTEVSFVTVAWADSRLEQLLDRIDEFDSPSQKVLAGVLGGLPLHGEELIEQRRARVGDYPEALRQAMIERHWSF